jgi:hypothetical protein
MVRPAHLIFLCAAALLTGKTPEPAGPPPVSWRSLQPGVELAVIPAGTAPSGKAGELYAVRVDPGRVKLGVGLASEGGAPRTAQEWCRMAHFAVAINLGMYQSDHRLNVGYLRHGQHVNNPRWNDYRSAVAIHPTEPSLPPVLWVDLDPSKPDPRLAGYEIVVQNPGSSPKSAKTSGRRTAGGGAKHPSRSIPKGDCSSWPPAHRTKCGNGTSSCCILLSMSRGPCISKEGRR